MYIPLPALLLFTAAAGLYLLIIAWVTFYTFRMGRTWTPIHPRVSLISEDSSLIPEAAAIPLRALEVALLPLGFTPVGILMIERPGLFQTYLLVLGGSDGGTVANVCIHYARVPARTLAAWMVEFWNGLENGTEVSTQNGLAMPELAIDSSKIVTWCGDARDPSVLHRLHTAALSREVSRVKRHGLSPDTFLTQARAELFKAIDSSIAKGGFEINADHTLHRMTWARIAHMLATNLPPAGTIRKRLARQRLRPLLREAGITPQELRYARTWSLPRRP